MSSIDIEDDAVVRLTWTDAAGALHAQRLVLSRLGPPSKAIVQPPTLDDEVGDPTKIIDKLFKDIAPRFKDRPGGYTRIIKLGARQGDAAEMVYLELVDHDPHAGHNH